MGVIASPFAQVGPPLPACNNEDVIGYKITEQKDVEGAPVVGSRTCSGKDGTSTSDIDKPSSIQRYMIMVLNHRTNQSFSVECELSDGSSYTIGVQIEVGASLDLGGVVGAGVEGSVSTSEETQDTQAATVKCPEGEWKCSLIIWPAMHEVSGTFTRTDGAANVAICATKDEPFKVHFPRTGDDKIKGARTEVCVCKNLAHWADAGAPQACPADCNQ